MRLTHDDIDGGAEGAVVIAEPAVLEAVRMRAPVLLPQQHLGDALTPQLLVDFRPVGLWTASVGWP